MMPLTADGFDLALRVGMFLGAIALWALVVGFMVCLAQANRRAWDRARNDAPDVPVSLTRGRQWLK